MILPPHPPSFKIREAGIPLSQVVLSDTNQKILDWFLQQHRQAHILAEAQTEPQKTLLLTGESGTGKTYTARAITHELHKTLYEFDTESLSANDPNQAKETLRTAFEFINAPGQNNVFLFDEFEALATARSAGYTDPTIRIIANRFLRYMEHIDSQAIIICCTNYEAVVDEAVRRRLKTVCRFASPTTDQRANLIRSTLLQYNQTVTEDNILYLADNTLGISLDETKEAVMEAIKRKLLRNTPITFKDEITALQSRKAMT